MVKVAIGRHIRKLGNTRVLVGPSVRRVTRRPSKIKLSKARKIKAQIKSLKDPNIERGFGINKGLNTSKVATGVNREVEIKGLGSTKNLVGSAHNHPQNFAPPSTEDLALYARQNKSTNYVLSNDGTVFRVSPGNTLNKEKTQSLINRVNALTSRNPLLETRDPQHATNIAQMSILKKLDERGIIKFKVRPTKEFKDYMEKSKADIDLVEKSDFFKDVVYEINAFRKEQQAESKARLARAAKVKDLFLDDLF